MRLAGRLVRNARGKHAEHRADYPADGIRWALAGAAHPARRVLDLGAGTGKLAEGLLALGLEVTGASVRSLRHYEA